MMETVVCSPCASSSSTHTKAESGSTPTLDSLSMVMTKAHMGYYFQML